MSRVEKEELARMRRMLDCRKTTLFRRICACPSFSTAHCESTSTESGTGTVRNVVLRFMTTIRTEPVPFFARIQKSVQLQDSSTSPSTRGGWARYVSCCCALLATIFSVAPATAKENAAELANQASAAIQAGDLETAIQQYDAASALSPDPRIIYNKAIAHYRKGEIDTSRGLFASLIGTGDHHLAAKARYNMGNADYAEAVHFAGEDDKPTAIAKLRSAIDHYRRALAIDRNDADARANIELAHRLLKQLEQQQQQEQQQQDQQQRDPQQQNNQNQQDKENSDDSQDQQQQSQNQESEERPQDQQQQQQPKQQESQQEPSEDQQSKNQQQDSEAENQDQDQDQDQQGQEQPQQQSDESPQPGEENKQPSQRQNSQQQPGSEEQPDQREQTDAAEGSDQQAPDGDLKPMNEPTDESQNSAPPEFKAGQKMTMEEARKMLQAVRDRNLQRRLQKLRQTRARQIPVEKDW